MRELRNMEAFEKDFRKFYNGNQETLDMKAVIEEIEDDEGFYELKKYDSSVGYGKTFFFDEELICVDEENEEYSIIATYSGHGNH